MANYGPPDGTAGESWRGRRAEDAYGPPEHGWRDAYPPGPNPGTYPSGYDSPPRHDTPHAGSTGYGPQQGYGAEAYRPAYSPWSAPAEGPSGHSGGHSGGSGGYAGAPAPPSRPSRGKGRLVAVLAAVLLLVLGGGAAILYLLGQDDTAPPAASPTAAAAAGSSGPAGPGSPAPSVAAPESSADPRFVKVGQCVRNDGPAGGKPKLLISECATKTYEVLHRVDGPTTGEKDAAAKCAKVDDYTNWYFFDSELDTLDFVLCLKQR